jgi:hypothetical protein
VQALMCGSFDAGTLRTSIDDCASKSCGIHLSK